MTVDPLLAEAALRRGGPHPFLDGIGATGDLIRSTDWSKTALGPISSWPPCLKTTLATMLRSRHPTFLMWGPDLVQFYNEAYVPSFGLGKHPAAMGQRARDCWPEIWPIIGPQIDDVMNQAKASWNEDALVPFGRNGRIEEAYWTYSYSPVMDDSGEHVCGTLVVGTETTRHVLALRRLHTIRTLVQKMAECVDEGGILDAMHAEIATASFDIPFALTYGIEDDAGEPSVGTSVNLQGPLRASIAALVREHLDGMKATLLTIPPADRALGGPWPEASSQVFVVPLEARGQVFVFGVSARLAFDDAYRNFLGLFVEQIDVALARVHSLGMRGAFESERRNLILQAPMPTALLTGPEHLFVMANPAYRKMVGGREVVGRTYLDAFPELVGTVTPGILDHVFRTGEPHESAETSIPLDRKGDGKLEDCFFKFNLEPMRDEQNQVYGVMAVAVEITEQVNARRALEKSASEREAMLRQLEAADRAKDEFLAIVSHELRTPLTAILGWARLLDEHSEPARLRKGLRVIERGARAQAQLIEDLLDVSRIISGKIRMTLTRVDLAAVVSAAVETVRPVAVAKDVRLRVDLVEALGTVIADEIRLQQVVWNLLSNAVKFTPKGGEVTLTVARDAAHVTITVRDTGRGIPAAVLPRLFERFQQDDSSTTRDQGGLGLGLAIVRHLVELHGGVASVHSEGEGKGATFEVRLPVRAIEPAADVVPSDRKSGALLLDAGASRGRLHGLHVLVVDDQDDGRDWIATVLEDAVAQVTQAESATAAMKVLATTSSRVSVIVSDVGMPGEDGHAFLRRVRAADSASTRHVPALALTAFAHAEDRHKALAAGFQEHVAKPIDPADLVDAVAALTGRRGMVSD